MEPYAYENADGRITASFDHLLGMAQGTVSSDKLFITGQLKVEGNLSKSAALRELLSRPKGYAGETVKCCPDYPMRS